MSAWLVSKRHIDALVFARTLDKTGDYAELHKLCNDALGRMLWRENMLSLEARYRDAVNEALLDDYHYDHKAQTVHDVVTMIKAIHCYRYQSCAHEAWEESKAAKYCTELESMLVHELPGYDVAPWGID